MAELLIGFDSAWADNPKAPGAICALRTDASGDHTFIEPRLANFSEAQAFVEMLAAPGDLILVAIDQPLIVTNPTGKRPCESVASAVIGRMKSAVQPANLEGSGARFFGPASGIRRFLSNLKPDLDPHRARTVDSGLFAIEVFPALALATLAPDTWARRHAAKYNPANRRKFSPDDWRLVCRSCQAWATARGLLDIAAWLDQAAQVPAPRKADQDRLDAALCLLIAHAWRSDPEDCVAIGCAERGCIVTPWSREIRPIIETAALIRNIPLSGTPDNLR